MKQIIIYRRHNNIQVVDLLLHSPHTSLICFDNLNDPRTKSEYDFSPRFKSLTAIFELFKMAFLKTGIGFLSLTSALINCCIFDSCTALTIMGLCAVDDKDRRIIIFAKFKLWFRNIFVILMLNDETENFQYTFPLPY